MTMEPQSEKGPRTAANEGGTDPSRGVPRHVRRTAAERSLAGGGLGTDAVDWLIIAVAAGVLFARIMLAEPLQSANDRSRWCTVFSLVEDGTYRIDRIASHPRWDTIDKVLHEGHFYSSKPPLLATVTAGLYWIVKHTLGWDLWSRTAAVSRLILLVINWMPWVLALVALRSIVRRWDVSPTGRITVLLLAGFACLVLPFLTTLNNHTVAASSLVFALWGLLRIVEQPPRTDWIGRPLPVAVGGLPSSEPAGGRGAARSSRMRDLSGWLFAWTGFWAAMVPCHELPAFVWGPVAWWLCLRQSPRRTWLFFVPAALVPLGAFFVTNYIATGGWKPFYAYYGTEKYRYVVDGIPSYWADPHGIDRGGESPLVYLFHCVLGHHGIVSLYPALLVTVYGWWLTLGRRSSDPSGAVNRPGKDNADGAAEVSDTAPDGGGCGRLGALRAQKIAALLGLLLTVWILAFYLSRTANYNYGGVSAALRWAIWLTPLWLLPVPAAVEHGMQRFGHRAFAAVLAVLLAISAFSATYPFANPWQHPWLYVLLERWGLIDYRDRPVPFPRDVWSWVVNPPSADSRGDWVELAGYDETGQAFVIRITDRGPVGDGDDGGDGASRATRGRRWLEIRWQAAAEAAPCRRAVYMLDADAWADGAELEEYLLWPRKGAAIDRLLGNVPRPEWLPNEPSAEVADQWTTALRGVPRARPYYPGLIRYVKTPLRREAFRCQRSATQVLYTPPGRRRPLRFRCDLWISPEVPFGIVQVEWTVWDVDRNEIVHRRRATVRSASRTLPQADHFVERG
ncbi:MAG: hypothetical protein D6725_13905 [Planctomycetota bacterium]|nr:MAG: hypothetical protein D6725_13905 [Planctomycetota bacterium]